MIGHLPGSRQDAASEFDDWLDLDRLAGEVGDTPALLLLGYSPYVGFDGRAVVEAEFARVLLALEEVRT